MRSMARWIFSVMWLSSYFSFAADLNSVIRCVISFVLICTVGHAWLASDLSWAGCMTCFFGRPRGLFSGLCFSCVAGGFGCRMSSSDSCSCDEVLFIGGSVVQKAISSEFWEFEFDG